MKKQFFLILLALGFTQMVNAEEQSGVLMGTTRSDRNTSGGYTYTCPSSSNICTVANYRADGTLAVTVYLYDDNGNFTGTKNEITKPLAEGGGADADPDQGYINNVETAYGAVWTADE